MNSDITKNLLKIVILIVVISYGLDKILFLSMNNISDKVLSGQAIGKLNQFLSIKDTADFIVFGSSRANRHLDVDLFSNNGFNMGIDGIGIAYYSTLINTLHTDKEQLIIVHIDIKNFFGDDYDGSDIRALKTKYHREDEITQNLDRSGQISVLQKFYYSMNYNGNSIGIIKNYFRPSYDPNNYNGYDALTVNKSQEHMRDAVLLHSKNSLKKECQDSLKVNPIGLRYLESIKSFAKKSPNKTFLFISSPTYNDICDSDNAEINVIMQDFGLTYWDFTNLYNDRQDNTYWKDASHMSKQGAEAFSLYLLKQYEKSNLKNTSISTATHI